MEGGFEQTRKQVCLGKLQASTGQQTRKSVLLESGKRVWTHETSSMCGRLCGNREKTKGKGRKAQRKESKSVLSVERGLSERVSVE